MELPGILYGANRVVAPMDDRAGDVLDRRRVGEKLVLRLQEAAVLEVVALDAREGQRKSEILAVALDRGVREQGRNTTLIETPGGRTPALFFELIACESTVVGTDEIVMFVRGNGRDEIGYFS